MKIELSRHLGYCFGVRRAMDLAFQNLARQPGPVYSHGPLIHNRPARKLLVDKGLALWPGSEHKGPATVIIRAHGLPPAEEEVLRSLGVNVVDATCPRVAWVQRLVQKQTQKGCQVLIWGSAGHPEVEGLLGYAENGLVIGGPEDVLRLPNFSEVFLVAQTTQDRTQWPAVARAVLDRWPRAVCRDTICQATYNRQTEAKRLAGQVDCLVVVGGRDSANTQRLVAIGQNSNVKILAIEGPEEIEPASVEGLGSLGLVAGASTPIWQIRSVLQRLEAIDRRQENTVPAFFRRLFRALALSNIFVGLGAGFLGWAIAVWAGYKMPDIFFGLYFFYVQAMHLLNGFLDRESARYNDPDRAVFLRQYRLPLMASGVASLLLAISAAYLAGPLVLFQLLLQSGLGLAYALPWPGRIFGIRRLKDLPLSKLFSICLGWAVLLVGPLILADPPLLPRTVLGFQTAAVLGGAVFLNLLTRTMLMDLQDAYGDRLFVSTTLATLVGKKGAINLLALVLIVWSIYLLTAYFFGHGPVFILWLFFSGPLYNGFILNRFFRNPGLSGFQFDLLVDGQFILSGALACLWSLL